MNTANATRRITEIMTSDVIKIGVEDGIHSALELMCEHRVSALPVVDKEDRCVGILSITDLNDLTRAMDMTFDEGDGDVRNHIWACGVLRDHFGSELVTSVMTKDVQTLPLDTTIRKAAQLMSRDRIHHVPIVDQSGFVRGMLSTFDLVKVLAE